MVSRPGLAVPFYVHPTQAPEAWSRLRSGELGVGLAVVNVHNGVGAEPGSGPDPAYRDSLAEGAAVPLVGYIVTEWGARPAAELLAEARCWRRRYGLRAIFLDQVDVSPAGRAALTELCHRLREHGVSTLALNPGREAAPWLHRLGDLVCDVELGWDDYLGLPWPDRRATLAARHRTWHLVHSVPENRLHQAARLAADRGATWVWVTSNRPPHPWAVVEPDGSLGLADRAG